MPDLSLKQFPMIPVALAVVAGIALSLFLNVSVFWLFFLTIGILILSAVAVIRSGWNFVAIAGILLLFVCLGMIRANLAMDRETRVLVQELAARSGQTSICGVIQLPASDSPDGRRVLLKQVVVSDDSGHYSLHSLRVWCYADSSILQRLRYGDFIVAKGRLQSASEIATISSVALITSLVNCEAGSFFADTDDISIERVSGHVIRREVDRLRTEIIEIYDRRLSADGSALCKALVLGDRSDFSDEFSNSLKLTGLSHIFALSGMNVGLLISLVWLFLSLLLVPRTARYWVLLFVICLYMELGREVPSLVRASLMCGFFVIGRMLTRRGEILNYIAAAACLELLLWPLHVLDTGFLLSYLAILGILGCYPFFRLQIISLLGTGRIGFRTVLVDVLAGTCSAQLGTIPLIGFLFHRIPFLGVLGNLIAVPGFAVMLFLSVTLLIAETVSSALATLFAPTINAVAFALGISVRFMSVIPFAAFPVGDYSLLFMAGLYLVIIGAMFGLYFKRLWWTFAAVLLAANLFVWGNALEDPAAPVLISFIDVGTGDAVLISTCDNHHVLVDTGPSYGDWSAASRITRLLAERRIGSLDALILTHPENDHIGGAADLIQRIPIARLYMNGDSAESWVYTRLMVVAESKGLRPCSLKSGDVLSVSPCLRLQVLSPDSATIQQFRETNRRGIVLRVDAGTASALLTADVDSVVEHELTVWRGLLDVDLLKIGHHGSKSSSCYDFLKSTSPKVCAISVGKRNHYGHPSPIVLDRLAALAIPVYLTSKEGTVTFESTWKNWKHVESSGSHLARLWSLPFG